MPKAVFFDIDRTLIDSLDLHAVSWARTFAHFRKMLPVSRIRFQIGKGGDQLSTGLIKVYGASCRTTSKTSLVR